VQDCAGTWGGFLVYDDCGVCGGDDTSCADCAGVPNGDSWESDCGCVAADNSGDDCDDCAGVPNGDAVVSDFYTDTDGDGLGSGSALSFCDANVPSGFVANNDDSDDACFSNVHDCFGECDGTGWESDCGCVAGDNDGNDCDDCAGVPNGDNLG